MENPGVLRRNVKAWLMTVALVIVPWGGVFVLLYGAGLLVVSTWRVAAASRLFA